MHHFYISDCPVRRREQGACGDPCANPQSLTHRNSVYGRCPESLQHATIYLHSYNKHTFQGCRLISKGSQDRLSVLIAVGCSGASTLDGNLNVLVHIVRCSVSLIDDVHEPYRSNDTPSARCTCRLLLFAPV